MSKTGLLIVSLLFMEFMLHKLGKKCDCTSEGRVDVRFRIGMVRGVRWMQVEWWSGVDGPSDLILHLSLMNLWIYNCLYSMHMSSEMIFIHSTSYFSSWNKVAPIIQKMVHSKFSSLWNTNWQSADSMNNGTTAGTINRFIIHVSFMYFPLC